jgi:hypothetical protein
MKRYNKHKHKRKSIGSNTLNKFLNIPAVTEPPGELMNNLMSFFESSASRNKSWLMIKSAVTSSTCRSFRGKNMNIFREIFFLFHVLGDLGRERVDFTNEFDRYNF